MKNWILVQCAGFLSVLVAAYGYSDLLVGQYAPDFTATAIKGGSIEELSLSDFRGKYVVLFFYPLDFTFVCPTELRAFQEKSSEFA